MDERMAPAGEEQDEVTLLDENGKEVRFDHLLTFFHEGEKYIALLPLDDVENVGEDEVVLLHVVSKNGEDVYETIENEVLLDEVFDTFMELFEEMVEQED
ncbi:MAG TPA: DUF1292 domain-containing protein [Feifaniaceae bacterium]|nr:DUF1292 domain-containing protein [Feifaniaceae bacterium]